MSYKVLNRASYTGNTQYYHLLLLLILTIIEAALLTIAAVFTTARVGCRYMETEVS